MPATLRHAIGRVGRFFGAPPGGWAPSITASLHYLAASGVHPVAAIDIGAYRGDWTRLFKGVFPHARVLMVEAQERCRTDLEAVCQEFPGHVWHRLALLGSSNGRRVRFVEMETGSSVFEEASPYQRNYVEKEVVTLDTLAQQQPEFSTADFLKLDVQGYEIEILEGAHQVLQHAEFVLLEASLVPINDHCPLIDEVMGFMRDAGYSLLDICALTRRKDGVLWQTDLLFIRQGSRHAPRPRLDNDNWA
jgi:FkbM family methyltransferase